MTRAPWITRVQHRSRKLLTRSDGSPTVANVRLGTVPKLRTLVRFSSPALKLRIDVTSCSTSRSGAYPFSMEKTWTSTSGDIVSDTDVRAVVDEARLRELLSNLEAPTDDDVPFKFAEHRPVPLGE